MNVAEMERTRVTEVLDKLDIQPVRPRFACPNSQQSGNQVSVPGLPVEVN